MNRLMKAALLLLALVLLPVLSLADAPVLLLNLPESAQMVENVEFENGDFIQTYQLDGGVSVQLLRYTGFTMTMDELISSDWPINCGVVVTDVEISGYPAQQAHIWQVIDEGGYPVKAGESGELADGQQMMEIELIVVHVDDTTLIYQDSYLSGQRGDSTLPILESLEVLGGESAEVG